MSTEDRTLLEIIVLKRVVVPREWSKPTTSSWAERSAGHTGNEKHSAVGSSGGYWSMNESLNQDFAEMIGCNDREGYGSCKVCARTRIMMLCLKRTPG